MTLSAGTKLGPYEILSPLGAGGMGEVYRARDTRLGRDVAIKVLPQHLSANAEVRARFEREAKTVSSLNHPNICTLFDVGRDRDTDYLVMELVDGETLAHRVAKGALPTSEVLRIGAQIADALDRAHRAGVVHRDLKPGNVMLTKGGVKLMDFGLARATGLASPSSGSAALSQSPTIAQPLTAEGTILGTFQYMAPEQLEGSEADTRSDVWALGCVLYEMATGARAFDGKSQASLIAAIIREEPRPLRELQPASPPGLDVLIRECIAKDPEERRQSAGDVRRELNRIARGEIAVEPRSRRSSRWLIPAMIVAAVAAAAGYFAGYRGAPKTSPTQVSFMVPAPPGGRFRFTIAEDGTQIAPVAISPDGQRMVFGIVDGRGQRILVVRSMEDTELTVVPGALDARTPFWSPDGRSIGFFSEEKLRIITMPSGEVVTVTDGLVKNPRGATWSGKGTILFAPSANSGLFAVPATGGSAVQVTFPDTTLPDISHRWPVFLPDDDHFLFVVWTNNPVVRDSIGGIYMGSLQSRDTKRIQAAVSRAVFVNGWLIFVRGGTLFRARFDPGSGKIGELVSTGQRVGWDTSTGLGLFDVSATGTLVCREIANQAQRRLVWFDRTGSPLDTIASAANYGAIKVAPHESVAAVVIANPTGDGDIWTVDFARDLASRYTSGAADEQDPVLSADGRSLAYTSDIAGPYHVFIGPADLSATPRRVSPPSDDWNLLDWSADQRLMLLGSSDYFWILDVAAQKATRWYKIAGSSSSAGCFSPDSKWLAYASSESGRDEIFVRPCPGPGGQWQVSTDGGFRPHWSSDGREIVYSDRDGVLMSVDVSTKSGFRTSAPRRLFRAGDRMLWSTNGDHSRFLLAVRNSDAVDPPLKVVTQWLATAREPKQ